MLLGFMSEQETVTFLKGRSLIEGATDEKLREIWKTAGAAVETSPNPNLAAEILEMEDALIEHLDAVARSPVFPEAVQNRQWSFKYVEIDKLVCFQKHVDTDYAVDIAKSVDLTDKKQLLEFCLPLKPQKRRVGIVTSPDETAFTVFSPNIDLRILGGTMGDDPITNRKSLNFLVGFGIRFIQVVWYGGRYFLKNGYHHVYALRQQGIKHVPCILTEGQNYADTGAARPGFFPQELMMSDKPPVFADFFSDSISPPLRMLPLMKVIRVKGEEILLPATVQVPPMSPIEAVPSIMEETIAATPRQIEFEDFNVVKEDWNVYRLNDGCILRLRQFLVKLGKPDLAAPSSFNVELSNLFVATLVPARLKGPPSTQTYTPQQLDAAVVQRNLNFQTIREPVNEYVTEHGLKLSVRVHLQNVSRTNKFDASGYPYYLVNSETSFEVSPAEVQNNL